MSASAIPDEMRRQLRSDPFGVAVTDEQGAKVAVLVSPAEHEKLLHAYALSRFSEEELSQKVDPAEPTYALTDILADLERP